MPFSSRNRIAAALQTSELERRAVGNGIVVLSTRRHDGNRGDEPSPTTAPDCAEFGRHVFGIALVDRGGEDVAVLVHGDAATTQPDGALVISRSDGLANVVVAAGVWRCVFALQPDAAIPVAVAGWRPV